MRNPGKKFVLRSFRNQLMAILIIIIFNVIYYIPFLINLGLLTSQNDTVICHHTNAYLYSVINVLDIINATLLPFSLMILSTIGIVIAVYKSKKRIANNIKTQKSLRCMKFTVTSVFNNVFFLVSNSPFRVHSFFLSENTRNKNIVLVNILRIICYSSMATSLMVYLVFNAMFREQFFIMVGLKRFTAKNKMTKTSCLSVSHKKNTSNQLSR